MNLETKYGIGDEVWYIVNEYNEDRYTDCSLCRASGRVAIQESDTLTAECPGCFGQRRVYAPVVVSATPHRLTVGQVQVTVIRAGDNARRKVTYMCDETGLGSGMIHLESNLYPSYAAAKSAIEEKK